MQLNTLLTIRWVTKWGGYAPLGTLEGFLNNNFHMIANNLGQEFFFKIITPRPIDPNCRLVLTYFLQ